MTMNDKLTMVGQIMTCKFFIQIHFLGEQTFYLDTPSKNTSELSVQIFCLFGIPASKKYNGIFHLNIFFEEAIKYLVTFYLDTPPKINLSYQDKSSTFLAFRQAKRLRLLYIGSILLI